MRSRSFTAAALVRAVRCLLLVCAAVTFAPLNAQSTLPTEDAAYFNDFAHVMPAERATGVATHLAELSKRHGREVLAGLGGPDAEEIARGFSAEEMSEDLNRQPSVSPTAGAFERPIFGRPDTPSQDDNSLRTPQ